MESGFSNVELMGGDLLEPLRRWVEKGVSFSNYIKSPGGYFTIDGLSAQLLGVPVLMDRIGVDLHGKVRKIKTRGVLSKACSIFNVLSDAGWQTYAYTGASGNYTQKESFFRSHGFQAVFCKEYWDGRLSECDKKMYQNKEWGYSDSFLFGELEGLLENIPKNSPFAVLLETADTHPPSGSVPDELRRYGDVRDAFFYASQQVANFLDWASQKEWFEDTVFVIVGDHPWQDWEKASFTKRTRKLKKREIFNLIINPCNDWLPGTYHIADGWSPVDWAPTLCEAMGVELNATLSGKRVNSAFGLGRSLFKVLEGKQQTLIAAEGVEEFSNKVEEPSRKYEELF